MSTHDKKWTKIKKTLQSFLKKNYLYLIMVILVLFRVGLGYAMGGWHEVNALYDDGAMMQGLSLERLVKPNEWSLIKHLGFSVFLGISAITNLPYTVILSLFWSLAALVIFLLVKKVTHCRWVQLFAFCYILFLPIAFTSWGGLRIYRNAVIPPAIILTFGLILILLVNLIRKESLKKSVWIAFFAGLAFAFTYFLKEDGIWIKACMAIILLICLIIIAYRFFKKKHRSKRFTKNIIYWTIVSIIPFLVLFVSDNIYRGFNHYFFGVYEINTRTEGELGDFVFNIYKIDSPNRTSSVWAPYDAIESAFDASPTLRAHPQLLNNILHTEWRGGDIKKNPIPRDFLTWIIRTELVDSGLWSSEKNVSDFFAQVNNELDESFRNGSLKKAEGRIQLLKSTGGYNWDEIIHGDLLSQIWMTFADSNWFSNYVIGFGEGEVQYGTKGKEWDYTGVNKILHMEGDVNVLTGKRRDFAKAVGNIICIVYRAINSILVIVIPSFTIYQIIKLVKKWKQRKSFLKTRRVVFACILTSLLFLVVALAYSFATAWFFIEPAGTFHGPDAFIFYTVGVPAILSLSYISAVVGIAEECSGKINLKRRLSCML